MNTVEGALGGNPQNAWHNPWPWRRCKAPDVPPRRTDAPHAPPGPTCDHLPQEHPGGVHVLRRGKTPFGKTSHCPANPFNHKNLKKNPIKTDAWLSTVQWFCFVTKKIQERLFLCLGKNALDEFVAFQRPDESFFVVLTISHQLHACSSSCSIIYRCHTVQGHSCVTDDGDAMPP